MQVLPEVWKNNINVIWQVIQDYLIQNDIKLQAQEQEELTQRFNIIVGEYYHLRYHTHKYKTINREILTEMHTYIRNYRENDTQKQTQPYAQTYTQSQPQPHSNYQTQNVPITHAEISQMKQEEFSNNFTKIQNEFNQYNQKQPPKNVRFEEDIDEPQENMDELLKKALEERKYDVLQIQQQPTPAENLSNTQTQDVSGLEMNEVQGISNEIYKPNTEINISQEIHEIPNNKHGEITTIQNNDEDLLKKVIEYERRIDKLEQVVKIITDKMNISNIIYNGNELQVMFSANDDE